MFGLCHPTSFQPVGSECSGFMKRLRMSDKLRDFAEHLNSFMVMNAKFCLSYDVASESVITLCIKSGFPLVD